MNDLKSDMAIDNHISITVLVPIYNTERYLHTCLESIRSQTFYDFEVICIDDGSTDDSGAIVDRFVAKDDRFRKIRKSNSGYGNSMNIGLDESRGRFIAIVESDDFIEPDMLETLYYVAVSEHVDVVKCSYMEYHECDGRDMAVGMSRFSYPDVFNVHDCPWLLKGHPSVWCCLYSSDFIRDNDIRFVEPEGAGWADNPFMYDTLLRAERIAFVDRALYHYRVTEGNSPLELKDCNTPFDRLNDMFGIVKELNITDEGILSCFHERILHYTYLMFNNKNFDAKALRPVIADIALRMDPDIIRNGCFTISQRLLFSAMRNDVLYYISSKYYHSKGMFSRPSRIKG